MKGENNLSLWNIYRVFAEMGAVCFGGGYAMLSLVQRVVVEEHGWATEEELMDYYAIGQCTPGIIAVNTATFIGQKHRGTVGGIVSTLGVVFPSLIIITLIAAFLDRFAELALVKNAFAGIRACVVVLIFNAVVKLYKKSVKDTVTLAIFLIVAVGSYFTDLSPVIFVVLAGVAGVLIQSAKAKEGK